MKLNKNLKEQIKKDIEFCRSFNNREGTKKAYFELIARYNELDADFSKKIPTNGKCYAIGNEPDYLPELQAIATKLETYLVLGKINNNKDENIKNRKNKIIIAIITGITTILATAIGAIIALQK